MTKKETSEELLQKLKNDFALHDDQIEKFNIYMHMLIEWNNNFNLTSILDPVEIIQYHFHDSLILTKYVSSGDITAIGDIGTGGGFPGIPLKIFFPDIPIVLIEVCKKKGVFLREVVQALSLNNVHISDLDWRTFLRKTDFPINLFVARASLQPEELVRVFKTSSPYKNSTLVYWASIAWHPDGQSAGYITKKYEYAVGSKSRVLCFFNKGL